MSGCVSVRMKQLGSHWSDFWNGFFWEVLQKFVELVNLGSSRTNITESAFLQYLGLSPTPLTRAHWGCYGNEAMAISFINLTAAHDINKRSGQNIKRKYLNGPRISRCTVPEPLASAHGA
jgi:hypothetical protein